MKGEGCSLLWYVLPSLPLATTRRALRRQLNFLLLCKHTEVLVLDDRDDRDSVTEIARSALISKSAPASKSWMAVPPRSIEADGEL